MLRVKVLSELLGPLKTPYVLMLSGNPGVGKTVLASTICHGAASEGRKCLYVTFYEHREKLYSHMASLGIDLADLESRGLIKFARLPVPSGPDIKPLVDALTSLVTEDRFAVVVIDSISPLLEAAEPRTGRAWLANFFYNMAEVVGGLLVLVAEVSFGSEVSEAHELEFVADAIAVLKQRVEGRLIARSLELRKARGSPIPIAEVPFTIGTGGIRVWVPPVLSDVPPEGEVLDLGCEILERGWGPLRRGQVVYIVYPPDARHPLAGIIPYLIAVANGLRTIFVSYRYPPGVVRELILEALAELGIGKKEEAERLFEKLFKVVSINPFGYSVDQLFAMEVERVESENPDMVIFHAPELARAATDLSSHARELFNELVYLKSRKVLAVRLSSLVDERAYAIESTMSDAVAKIELLKDRGEPSWSVLLWSRGREPCVVSADELKRCVLEAARGLVARARATKQVEGAQRPGIGGRQESGDG